MTSTTSDMHLNPAEDAVAGAVEGEKTEKNESKDQTSKMDDLPNKGDASIDATADAKKAADEAETDEAGEHNSLPAPRMAVRANIELSKCLTCGRGVSQCRFTIGSLPSRGPPHVWIRHAVYLRHWSSIEAIHEPGPIEWHHFDCVDPLVFNVSPFMDEWDNCVAVRAL